MDDIILCSHNPILVKNLYGILRDEGYNVAVADHPAFAVQLCMHNRYAFVIFDSESFGLSVEDAIQIIKNVSPHTRVLVLGNGGDSAGMEGTKIPVDLEEFRQAIHNIHSVSAL